MLIDYAGMKLSEQIATQFRSLYFGGNWTAVNVKETVTDLNWQEANKKIHKLNTITALVYHTNYYVSAVLKVLEGEALHASDRYSFDHPPVQSQHEWEDLISKTLNEAERFASLVEAFPESKFWEDLADPKYGSYYRNIHGIIEHTHYHLGQIVLIKKILRSEAVNAEIQESSGEL